MSYFGHKSKFEGYFIAIGEILTLTALVLGNIFTIGYGIYQLFIGNFDWFIIVFFFIIMDVLIVYAIFFHGREKKKKEK